MSYQFKNITVLIVDSQPAMIELIQGVLHLMGVRRIIARTDGKSGIKAFKQFNPDLLIIDWDLDSLDGITFTKTIRSDKKNPFVPIIFMTAFSSERRVKKARDSGITEFLKKPFSAKSLYRRIEEIIERPRKFVNAPDFFGPDRRRRKFKEDFPGQEKRTEKPVEIDFVESKAAK